MASQCACATFNVKTIMTNNNNSLNDIFALQTTAYQPHSVLHGIDQDFRETNCYSDLIIEIVHGLGLNPMACLGYTLAADFEGDQWTFGKPSHHDLETMYGIRIEELSLYGALVDQIVTQVQRGSIPLVEADAFHLPDTLGIDYRTAHVKTAIGITAIDVANKKMNYFHNASFASLEHADFDGVLAPLASKHQGYLPPYCEIAKLNQAIKHDNTTLRNLAFASARHHLTKRPKNNPIKLHAAAIQAHQHAIIVGGLPHYHAYTFVALRQLGASHQLGAHYLLWLDNKNPHLVAAALAFKMISTQAKTLVLKLARVANSGKLGNFTLLFEEMSQHWDNANTHLHAAFNSKST